MQYNNVGNMRVPPTSKTNQMASSQFVTQTGNLYSSFETAKKPQAKMNETEQQKDQGPPAFLTHKKSQNTAKSMIFNPGPHPFESQFSGTLSSMAKFTRGSVEVPANNNPPSFLRKQHSRLDMTSNSKKDFSRSFKSPGVAERQKKIFENSSIVSEGVSHRARLDSFNSSNKQTFSPINPKKLNNETMMLLNKKMSEKQPVLHSKPDQQSTHNSNSNSKSSYKVPEFLKKSSPEVSETSSKQQTPKYPNPSKSEAFFNIQKVSVNDAARDQMNMSSGKGETRTFGFNNIVKNQEMPNSIFGKKNINQPLSGTFMKQNNTPQSNPFKPDLPNFQLGRLSSPSAFNNRKKPEPAARDFTLKDFELLDKIGKGAFGDVYISQEIQTGFMVVLKKVSKKKIKEQRLEEHILREIKVQAYLKHKHLTQLFGFFTEADHFYLILELLPDGSMSQVNKRKKIPQNQTSRYIRQICQGLRYMHKEDIIHRDLKPQNIFMNQNYLKLGDFGCAVYTHTLRNTMVGCLAYISPQQLNNESYDDKIDVWSVGILTYEIMTGKAPFQSDIMKVNQENAMNFLPNLVFPEEVRISDDAKGFMQSLLAAKPEERISLDQAMKHPFLTKQFQEDRRSEQEVLGKFQSLWKAQS